MKLNSALIKIFLVLGTEINGEKKICLKIVYETVFKKEDKIGVVYRVLEGQ